MSHPLPITLCLFTSSKGHFTRKTDYKLTLDHWDKQVPLSTFNLVAHIKITPGDESLAADIRADLEQRGFAVFTTTAAWSRGLSHGSSYLADHVTVSKQPQVYKQPYFLLLEDDSPALCHKTSLEDLLLRSCQMLAENHELLSVRVCRRGDNQPVIDGTPPDLDFFYSPHTDFQPILLRSIDFYRLCMVLEANPQACQQVHCEQLFRVVMDPFSRSPFKHAVYKPDYAETVHIGVPSPDHEAALQRLDIPTR